MIYNNFFSSIRVTDEDLVYLNDHLHVSVFRGIVPQQSPKRHGCSNHFYRAPSSPPNHL